MPMLILRSINGGIMAGFNKGPFTIRYSSLPLLPARVSVTIQSAGADGNCQWSETQGQKALPWTSSALTVPVRRLWNSTRMSISCGSAWGDLPQRGTEEYLFQEFLDSIKEYLQCKQPSTLPEVEQKWRLADACRPNPQVEFAAIHHASYE